MEITLAGLANSKSIFVFTDHVRSSLGRSFLSSNLSSLNGGFLSGSSSLNSGGSSKGESGSNKSSNLGKVVDDVGGDSVRGLGVNMDLGDVVDLVVNLGSNVSDNRGGDHLFLDSVDRDNGLVDGVMDGGDRGSSIGNSWGSSSMGKSGSRGNSGSSGIFGLNSGSGKNSSCVGSNSCKTNSSKTNTSQTSVSSSKELSISFSSRGSQGRGHE